MRRSDTSYKKVTIFKYSMYRLFLVRQPPTHHFILHSEICCCTSTSYAVKECEECRDCTYIPLGSEAMPDCQITGSIDWYVPLPYLRWCVVKQTNMIVKLMCVCNPSSLGTYRGMWFGQQLRTAQNGMRWHMAYFSWDIPFLCVCCSHSIHLPHEFTGDPVRGYVMPCARSLADECLLLLSL